MPMRIPWMVPFLLAAVAPADTVRSGNPLADAGFEHFYSLEYDQALESFQAEAAQNPSSPDALNHIAQTIMFRQIYRAGELESDLVTSANSFLFRPKIKLSTVDQERFSSALERAMALEDGLLKKNPQDSGALYTKGVSYGIRANYNFLFKKAFFDALRDTTTARKLESQVVEMDPSFIDARLILGVHDYVVGSLGLGWKMLGSVSGFHGDREQGIRTLKLVTEKGRLNRFDAQALLIAIYRREKMPEAAIPLLNDSVQRFPRSSLPRFELAEMYGDLGDRDRALAAIDEIERLKRADAPGYHTLPEAKIRFTRANALFSFNDLDRAFAEMRLAVDHASELDSSTAAFAWMRIGQIYDLKTQRREAVEAYRRAIQTAPDSDAANESKGYISARYKR